ncbi:MAG: diacylglycerol kinase family lipid kinase [Deinococcus sp.]|nr:diacylglycerol kinase family lipid kinase [Deinococcus sp.]
MPEMLIIANPVSSGGRGQAVGSEVARRLAQRGVQADLVFTTAPGDGRRLAAQALAEGCRRITVCGGDGTVHEVAGALATSPAALGIAPCGRGNDLARVLGIPQDLESVITTLVEGTKRRIDLGKIGERYFCTVACMGFDSEAAHLAHQGVVPFSGTAAYICAMLMTLFRYRSPMVQLEGDFGTLAGPILLAAAGNTTTYGGGMKITPQALWDDGLLDICMVRDIPKPTVLWYFPRIFSGTHLALPFVETRRTRQLHIQTSRPMWIYADGEPVCRTPVTITVAQQALTVLCPPSQPPQKG